jgi:hypothetical protein
MYRKLSLITALTAALAFPADAFARGGHGGGFHGGYHGGFHGGYHGGYRGYGYRGYGYPAYGGYGGYSSGSCYIWSGFQWVWNC